MKLWTVAVVTAGALAVPVVLPAAPAGAAGGGILNGDFETDPIGSPTITGWTTVDETIDLGVTQIGGCTTVDTSSYDELRGYSDEAFAIPSLTGQVGPGEELYLPGTTDPVWLDDETGEPTTPGTAQAHQVFYGYIAGQEETDYYVRDAQGDPSHPGTVLNSAGRTALEDYLVDVLLPTFPVPDPAFRQDTVAPVTDTTFWDGDPEFVSAVVDGTTAIDTDLVHSTQALEVRSDMRAREEAGSGYVAHGGAAVSDVYTTAGPRTVSLDWAASALEDDFHVLGYVLDVDTCQQYEVLDATGESSDWQTATVDLPGAGHFRFVFVSGTYDQTWGAWAGAVLYIDDIKAVPVQVGTGVDVQPLFDVGHAAPAAPVQLNGHGLAPNTDWSAVLRSTPVEFARGTTDDVGEFFTLTTLPDTVEPGRHELVLTATAPDDTTREDRLWITVDGELNITYVSGDSAQPTPDTGGTPVGTPVAGPEEVNGGQPTGDVSSSPAGAPDTRAGNVRVLATTGTDQQSWAVIAAVLLALGGTALRLGRQRDGRRPV